MEAAHAFLRTLAIVLGVAAVTTVVFQRLRQPVVLGYIVAGMVVGPHLPLPLDADPATVTTLSELGVILLMFAIGLELNLEKLVRVAPTAGVIALIQVALMIGAGVVVGGFFGWTQLESVFAGSAIAISSTTIIAKVFDELKLPPRLREIVYGVLIVEDIIAIIILATMSTVASGAGLDALTLAATTGKLIAFLVTMIVAGLIVVPRLMRFVVGLGRPETTVVASIGLCFGLAHACAAFHYSVALGAFVAGMLISESGEGHTVEHLIVPVRDMFAAIFFVSVGMLIDPRLVLDNWLAVVVLSLVVIVGKVFSVSLGGVVTGCGLRTSVRAGVSLSQIGEFSFIIVGLGLTLEATRPFLFPVAVAVSAITTLTTPALIRRSEAIASAVEDRFPRVVVNFVNVYSTWLDRVRSSGPAATTAGRLRRQLVLVVIDTAAVIGLFVGCGILHDRAEQAVAERFGLSAQASQKVFFAVVALVALPFVFGIVRLTRALALTIAGIHDEASASDSRTSRSVAIAVQVGLLSASAAITIAAVEPFVPGAVGAALFTVLVLTALYAFWRSAHAFDLEVQAGGAAVMAALKEKLLVTASVEESGAASEPEREPEPPSERRSIEALLPGVGAPTLIRIESASVAVGRTLRELDLRMKTGATVLALVRDGHVTMLPGADERIDVGDVVATFGSDEAVESARSFLGTAPSVPA